MPDRHHLNRREALAGFGVVSLGALFAACGGGDTPPTTQVETTTGATSTVEPKTAPSSDLAARFDASATCTQAAGQTEGPYYFDVDRVRSDITEGRPGRPLTLGVRVRDGATCMPIPDAVVDVWHCDASGVYSGFGSGRGETFLRGAQVTNDEGIARFRTIYPGAYEGRTTHIHAKVHLDNSTALTTQLYFDDAVSDRAYADAAYGDAAQRQVRNDGDGLYDASLELTLSEAGSGWLGLITLDVQRA